MKLDPNSKEELPAVVRVALVFVEHQLRFPEGGFSYSEALTYARALIAAYNASQPDEPSGAEQTLREIAKIVGDSDDYEEVFDAVCELKRKADEPSAKPMPPREEMVRRAIVELEKRDRALPHSEVKVLIDYILDGEAK